MRKRRIIIGLGVFLAAILAIGLLASGAFAGRSGLDIQRIEYNRDAAPNENAITIYHTDGKITFVRGNEFIPSPEFPTILEAHQRIDKIDGRGQDYLVSTRSYFDIYIYSLDNPGTPENELNFVTRFGNSAPTGQWW